MSVQHKKETKKAEQSKTREKGADVQKEEKKEEKKEGGRQVYPYIIILIILAVAVFVVVEVVQSSGIGGVSFSSFKQNFNAAQRVAIVVNFNNATLYGYEDLCSTATVEVVSSHRDPSTIDFYAIDTSNATCTYIPNGIGHPGNVTTTNSTSCLAVANSEPSITFNYAQANHTTITPQHLTIYGNSKYMQSCPIAVDMT